MIVPGAGAVDAPLVTPDESVRLKARKGSNKPRWRYTILVLLITLVALIPVFVTVVLSFQPQVSSTSHSFFTLQNFSYVFSQTQVLTWLRNSLIVTLATVLVAVIIAAPAGYVLSRSRSKAIRLAGPYP